MAKTKEILIPDIGDFGMVEVIDILVKAGDIVKTECPLISLESDKASMDIPSPCAGRITEIMIKIGDKVLQGTPILMLTEDNSEQAVTEQATDQDKSDNDSPAAEASDQTSKTPETPAAETNIQTQPRSAPEVMASSQIVGASRSEKAHASPSVRRFARELDVDLGLVYGSGPKGRIFKEDVKAFTKSIMSGNKLGTYNNINKIPPVDFSKFGQTELKKLSRLKRLSGQALYRSWNTIPHVTQFNEADITDLEKFRKSKLEAAQAEGVKLTLITFLIKAVVVALQKFPEFNSSLTSDGENLVFKKYFHIGMAVNTDNGLLVPVIKDADKKGLFEIAGEIIELSSKARARKLSPSEMQGGCFTISSLGSIGGTGFTPIVNAPEVAILGVSRAAIKPVYQQGEFQPCLMMPYALSYDHRVIDGVAGAQFSKYLNIILTDIRHILL